MIRFISIMLYYSIILLLSVRGCRFFTGIGKFICNGKYVNKDRLLTIRVFIQGKVECRSTPYGGDIIKDLIANICAVVVGTLCNSLFSKCCCIAWMHSSFVIPLHAARLNEAMLQPSAGHSVQYHIMARDTTIRDAATRRC